MSTITNQFKNESIKRSKKYDDSIKELVWCLLKPIEEIMIEQEQFIRREFFEELMEQINDRIATLIKGD